MNFLAKVCSLAVSLSLTIATAASAAERLTLRIGPFHQSLEVNDLVQFSRTGQLPPKLQHLAPLFTPQVRQALTKSFSVHPTIAEQFLEELFNSPEGEKLIQQLTIALPGSTPATIQAALKLAIENSHNLGILTIIQAYPSETITLDLSSAVGIAIQLSTTNLQSRILSPLLERELKVAITNNSLPNFDPAAKGKEKVDQYFLSLYDRQRKRIIPADIYYSSNTRGPLVVMSHGFAADRQFLHYLASHLASHGLTVVSLEHPDSNINSFFQLSPAVDLDKLLPPSEFVHRPQDVTFLLDKLEQLNNWGKLQGKLNTKEVVAIGHSFGGYTALALAGGELNPKQLRVFCQERSILARSPADWLQCAAADLPDSKIGFKDKRIVRAIAFNPLAGNLFGDSLKKIDIPILMLSCSQDGITPILEHQLRPFTQLPGEKYLLVAMGGTHMSVTDISNLASPMGQNTLVPELMGIEAEPIRRLARGMSLAFIQQLMPERAKYQPFLTAAYVQSLSSHRVKLRFASELPNSLNRWLNLVHLYERRVAFDKTDNPTFKLISWPWLVSKVKYSWFHGNHILKTKPKYSTAQLDLMFNRLLYNYECNS